MHVEPHDRFRCLGCGQLLAFDAESRVPAPQLRACRSRCEWFLLERRGAPVAADPLPDDPLPDRPGRNV